MHRRIARVLLAQKFPGWTLDYIDTLSPFDEADIWGVLDAQHKLMPAPPTFPK